MLWARLPSLVHPGEENQLTIFAMEPGRLPRGLRSRPLEKSVGRHHAAPLHEGLAKSTPLLHRLGARVDILARHRTVFGPRIDQPPSRGQYFAIFKFDSDYVVHLRRRDVIAGPIVDARVALDAEFRRQRIALA